MRKRKHAKKENHSNTKQKRVVAEWSASDFPFSGFLENSFLETTFFVQVFLAACFLPGWIFCVFVESRS